MKAMRAVLLAMTATLVLCRAAGATGLMIPEDRALPCLAIQSHRVAATITDGVAKVTEVFLNNTDRRLEATFIFPVPREAALTDFAMYVNGKRVSGEVLPAEQARRAYEDVVRRLRDPGLLEYMGSGMLRMKVFPIEPKGPTRVEVTYTATLSFDNGVYEYVYPMKTGSSASRVLEDFTLGADISSKQPIKNVYSPTYDVGITRKDDHHAVVGLEKTGATLDRDFTLFYTVSDKEFGLNLLTYRIEGQDGFLALMLSPRVEVPEAAVMAKDVTFVIDTSGSMQDQNRIASARDAVKFCLHALNPGDRFALVPFSTTVEPYGKGLQDAKPENVEVAVAAVEKLEANGGTDLCGAVLKALDMAPKGDRPYLVVLVTDGKPTVGVTDTDEIVKQVEGANQANIRVFPFGIADDLDVPLLDRIAETTRGYSDYVAPGRQIEERISSFFGKVSNPVLAGLSLDFGKVDVTDVYPSKLPDLFRGSQVLVFGRYRSEGDTALRLTGTVDGKKKEFVYDAAFPKSAAGNDFLPALWARRKIAYLLDQIRLHGRSGELVDAVVQLSREYGIVTPYTSYLVMPGEAGHMMLYENGVGGYGGAVGTGIPLDAQRQAAERAAMAGTATAHYAAGPLPAGPPTEQSMQLRAMKEAGTAAGSDQAAQVRRVAGRTFELRDGAWLDQAYKPDMDTLRIQWGSDAYFALLDALPDVKDCLALGEAVTIVIDGKALAVGKEGRDRMTADEVRGFFGM
jgi:Ca-activated chloride channel family protein